MKIIRWCCIALLLATPSVYSAQPPAALSNKLATMAGAGSENCGAIALHDDQAAAIACAKRAAASIAPYRIAVQLPGTDSIVWQGAARDEHGKLWVLFYDSDPSGGSGATPTSSVVPCREIQYGLHDDDIIECIPFSGIH
jgi:hypothetical protein